MPTGARRNGLGARSVPTGARRNMLAARCLCHRAARTSIVLTGTLNISCLDGDIKPQLWDIKPQLS